MLAQYPIAAETAKECTRDASSIAGCRIGKDIGPDPAETDNSSLVVHAKLVVALRIPWKRAAGCTDLPIPAVVRTADARAVVPPAALVFVHADRTVCVVQSPDSLVGGADLRSHRSVVVGSWAYRVVAERGRRDSGAAVMAFGRRGSSAEAHSRQVSGTKKTAGSAGVHVDLLDATSPMAGRLLEARTRCTLLSDLHWNSRSSGFAGDALLALSPEYVAIVERSKNWRTELCDCPPSNDATPPIMEPARPPEF